MLKSFITYGIGAIGLLGCDSADAIEVSNHVSVPFRFPLVSSSAISPVLSSPTDYPYFLRTNPAANGFSLATAAFIRELGGVNRAVVTVFRANDPATTAENDALMAATASHHLNVVANVSFEAGETDFSHVINVISSSGSNVIVLCAKSEDYAPLIAALYRARMTFPQYQIIGMNTLLRPDALLEDGHPSDDATAGIVGAIAIEQSAGNGAVYDSFSSAYLAARQQTAHPELYPESATADCSDTYDAVLLYSYAIRQVLIAGGNVNDGLTLMNALRNQSFIGASGVVCNI